MPSLNSLNPMNLFRDPAPKLPAETNQQTQTNSKPGDGLGGNKGQNAGDQVGSTQLDGGNTEVKKSPLEPFKDLWEPPKVEPASGTEGKPGTGTQVQNQQPNYSDVAKKLDFARSIPAESITKALSGDSAEFSKILNQVAQMSFAASGRLSDNIVARVSKELEQKITNSLPARFKEFSLSDRPSKNPALNHPAVKPLIEATKSQFALKFPEATTEELTEKAHEYISAIFGEINASEEAGKVTKAGRTGSDASTDRATVMAQQEKGEYDWNKHFGVE